MFIYLFVCLCLSIEVLRKYCSKRNNINWDKNAENSNYVNPVFPSLLNILYYTYYARVRRAEQTSVRTH